MKIKMEDGYVFIIEANTRQVNVIKPYMKWDRKKQWWTGAASLGLLDKLSELITLPEVIKAEHIRLKRVQDAVDKERIKPDKEVKPLVSYPVKKKLYTHQIRASNMCLMTFRLAESLKEVMPAAAKTNKGFAFLFEMGCGKTLTAIAVMGAAYQMGKVTKVLIVSPASVCAVWEKELEEAAGFPFMCKVMLGDKKKRLKALSDLSDCKNLKVAVTNYESVWRDGIFEALKDYDADMIICDESQRIKTHNTAQSKAMHKLGDMARYKLILSGTPVQNNAIDVWSQYRFLDRTVFGDSYYAFRNRYAVMGGFENKNIVGYKNLDELVKKEHSIALRVTKKEAVDLPEQVFETRYIEMQGKERKLYDTLRRNSIAELANGGQVTATTVLTKLLRLQQLTGGFLAKDDADKPEQVSHAKLDALKDIIFDYVIESGKKLVVFARFLAEVQAIMKLAEKMLPKDKKYVAIYGDIKKDDRGSIVEQFQADPATVLFIGQIDTAGTGITLTAADTCVYYSKNFNYAAYEQSLSRIHRIGQRNVCTYIDLVTKDSVDETVTTALRQKENLAKTVVDDWKKYF